MLPASYQLPAAVILVAGGALACFFGYRLFRTVLGIYGFILGALIATSVLGPTETSTTLLVATSSVWRSPARRWRPCSCTSAPAISGATRIRSS
jgi:hypothetical protein